VINREKNRMDQWIQRTKRVDQLRREAYRFSHISDIYSRSRMGPAVAKTSIKMLKYSLYSNKFHVYFIYLHGMLCAQLMTVIVSLFQSVSQ